MMTLPLQANRKRAHAAEQPPYPRKKICVPQDRLIMKLHNPDTMKKAFHELSNFLSDQKQKDLFEKLSPLVFESYLEYLSTRVKKLEALRSLMECPEVDASRSLRQKRRAMNVFPKCLILDEVLRKNELRFFNTWLIKFGRRNGYDNNNNRRSYLYTEFDVQFDKEGAASFEINTYFVPNKRIRGIISKITLVFIENIEKLRSGKPVKGLKLRLIVLNHHLKSGDVRSLGWHRDYCHSKPNGFEYFIDYLMLLPLTDRQTEGNGWKGGDLCLMSDNSKRLRYSQQPRRRKMMKHSYRANQAVVVDNMKTIHTFTDIEGMRPSNRTMLIFQAAFNKN